MFSPVSQPPRATLEGVEEMYVIKHRIEDMPTRRRPGGNKELEDLEA